MRKYLELAVALASFSPLLAIAQTPDSPNKSDVNSPPPNAIPVLANPAPPETPSSVNTPASPVAPASEKQPVLLPPEPLAGYAGTFFMRDPNDWFVLFPKGRLQVDGYFFPSRGDLPDGKANNGAGDPRPRDTVFVRRARAEVQGTFAKHFDFSIAGEFATIPGVGQYGTVTDCYVIINYTPYAQVQLGQFDVPFTMENRTSDKVFDFMERSLAVRSFGVPANKDSGGMVFGYLPNKAFYYSLGLFNGEGQSFKNQDNWPAGIGRAFVAPLAPIAKGRRWMEEMEVGGSVWLQHQTNIGGAIAPSTTGGTQNDLFAMTTQGGLGFFSSSYGNGAGTRSHLVPNGDTVKWALEAHIPIKKFGVKWELVHQSIDISQYNDVTPAAPTRDATAPGAKLEGTATYVEAYYWILGDRDMIEPPGLEPIPRLKAFKSSADPKWGLQVLAKYEHLSFDVSGLPDKDPAQGNVNVNAIELGLNGWLTKHVRLTANYVMNYIDGDTASVKKNFYFQKAEHELLFRAGINL